MEENLLTVESIKSNGLIIKNGDQPSVLTLQQVKEMTNTQALPDNEVLNFMLLCGIKGANPFTKEAYLLPYGNGGKANIIFSKEFFVRKAEEQPDFNGMVNQLIVMRNNQVIYTDLYIPNTDMILGATCSVFRKGIEHPFTATVSFNEYSTGKSLWYNKPATMIRKVAIVQALREAYGGLFGGVYTSEEQRVGESPDMVFQDSRPANNAERLIQESMRNNANIQKSDVVDDNKERIDKMLSEFNALGVSVEDIETKIEVKVSDLTEEHFKKLGKWYKELKTKQKEK